MKIEAQNSLILEIIKALKNNSSGIGLRYMYNIKIIRGSYTSSIEFIPKPGRQLNPKDFFYLGLDIDWQNINCVPFRNIRKEIKANGKMNVDDMCHLLDGGLPIIRLISEYFKIGYNKAIEKVQKGEISFEIFESITKKSS